MEIMAFQKDYTVCHNQFHTVQCLFIQDVFHVHSFNKMFDFHIFHDKCIFSLFLCTAESVY